MFLSRPGVEITAQSHCTDDTSSIIVVLSPDQVSRGQTREGGVCGADRSATLTPAGRVGAETLKYVSVQMPSLAVQVRLSRLWPPNWDLSES